MEWIQETARIKEMEEAEREVLGIQATELLRTFIHGLPPPRMLFYPHGDPFHRDVLEHRRVPVSPWAGPKALLGEV
eukprot:15453243-Alexandrium_andersonii.AAC.1